MRRRAIRPPGCSENVARAAQRRKRETGGGPERPPEPHGGARRGRNRNQTGGATVGTTGSGIDAQPSVNGNARAHSLPRKPIVLVVAAAGVRGQGGRGKNARCRDAHWQPNWPPNAWLSTLSKHPHAKEQSSRRQVTTSELKHHCVAWKATQPTARPRMLHRFKLRGAKIK